jgi:hypothetical protein
VNPEPRQRSLEVTDDFVAKQLIGAIDLVANALPELCPFVTLQHRFTGLHEPAKELAGEEHLVAIAQGDTQDRAATFSRSENIYNPRLLSGGRNGRS